MVECFKYNRKLENVGMVFIGFWFSLVSISMLQPYYHIIAGSLFIRYHNSSGLLFEQFQDLVQKRDSVHFVNSNHSHSFRPIYQPGPQNWCHKDALTPLSHFSFSAQSFLKISSSVFIKIFWNYHESFFDVNEAKHTWEIAQRTC